MKSNQSLSALIQFGWNVVRYKRIALLLQLESGIKLEFANNTIGLPFLVAAQQGGDKEQYICPLIGQSNPLLQNNLCDKSLSSIKNKNLRVSKFGIYPNVVYPEGGSDPRFLRMVAEKFDFTFNLTCAANYNHARSLVRP